MFSGIGKPAFSRMRLWSLHPKYLDAIGLVALWREGLLARAVLAGKTRGYRNHPQLERFSAQAKPVAAIDCYLSRVYDEAVGRGFAFDRRKIRYRKCGESISLESGQLDYEWRHLKRKLRLRDQTACKRLRGVKCEPHPCFRLVPGPVSAWERSH
jgi:hypothetical protein